jgi:hypothetical protein
MNSSVKIKLTGPNLTDIVVVSNGFTVNGLQALRFEASTEDVLPKFDLALAGISLNRDKSTNDGLVISVDNFLNINEYSEELSLPTTTNINIAYNGEHLGLISKILIDYDSINNRSEVCLWSVQGFNRKLPEWVKICTEDWPAELVETG